ncbi:ATP-dependent RNA helicase dbp7 [Phlyctochytrium planicorne]|nr:ATP-dependent RNA helicase dbp7 [Phlyctochytrium planicorne]
MSIKEPTRIQELAIRQLMKDSSRDVLMQAETGSGKTLAFLLPVLQRMLEAGMKENTLSRSQGTLALVLAPTRELAKQTYGVLENLLRYNTHTPGGESSSLRHWIVPGIVIGGDKVKSEKSRLRKGCNFLVSTPGRLLDHLNSTKSFEIGNLRWLILDEGDTFLEFGFEDALRDILRIVDDRARVTIADNKRLVLPKWPETRQMVLVSATLKDNVKRLAETSLVNPVFLSCEPSTSVLVRPGTGDDGSQTFSVPNQLRQLFVLVPSKLRLVALSSIFFQLQNSPRNAFKAILFTNTCDSVDFLFQLFTKTPLDEPNAPGKKTANADSDASGDENVEVKKAEEKIEEYGGVEGKSNVFEKIAFLKLHGNLAQTVRETTFRNFEKSRRSVLICTDVAARGLDLSNITDVVQYDLPTDVRDYVHRIGRTARIGKGGQAISFLLPSEADYVGILKEQGMNLNEVKINSLLGVLSKVDFSKSTTKRRKERSFEDKAMDLQMLYEKCISADPSNLKLAKDAFQSHIKAYATHSSSQKHIFHVKKLHLGHVAKAFALREIPSLVTNHKAIKERKAAKQSASKPVVNLKRKAFQLGASSSEFSWTKVDTDATIRCLQPLKPGRKEKKSAQSYHQSAQIRSKVLKSTSDVEIQCIPDEMSGGLVSKAIEEVLAERNELESKLYTSLMEKQELEKRLSSLDQKAAMSSDSNSNAWQSKSKSVLNQKERARETLTRLLEVCTSHIIEYKPPPPQAQDLEESSKQEPNSSHDTRKAPPPVVQFDDFEITFKPSPSLSNGVPKADTTWNPTDASMLSENLSSVEDFWSSSPPPNFATSLSSPSVLGRETHANDYSTSIQQFNDHRSETSENSSDVDHAISDDLHSSFNRTSRTVDFELSSSSSSVAPPVISFDDNAAAAGLTGDDVENTANIFESFADQPSSLPQIHSPFPSLHNHQSNAIRQHVPDLTSSRKRTPFNASHSKSSFLFKNETSMMSSLADIVMNLDTPIPQKAELELDDDIATTISAINF